MTEFKGVEMEKGDHSVEETRALHDQYMAAWSKYDVDAIVDMHAEDGCIQVHTAGEVEHQGLDAIRTQWATTLQVWPDLTFTTVRLEVAPGFVVDEVIMSSRLGVPLDLGTGELAPDGRRFSVGTVDIMRWRHGKLQRKDTYYDLSLAISQLSDGEVEK